MVSKYIRSLLDSIYVRHHRAKIMTKKTFCNKILKNFKKLFLFTGFESAHTIKRAEIHISALTAA